ncbi:MAG: hypothetical protein LBQ08_05075 [Holosporaceae bacterium]|jgi:lysozyme family protein|nr:hypothetical protein [Holosporaceae bacterium]
MSQIKKEMRPELFKTVTKLALTPHFLDVYNFQIACEKLIPLEEGYVKDPDDLGGETKYGISKRSYPHLDIKNLTLADARIIYYQDFWEELPTYFMGVDGSSLMMNLSANMGVPQAIKLLQAALGMTGKELDGIAGPATRKLLVEFYYDNRDDELISKIKEKASEFYVSLAEKNPSQKKFLNGWLNRLK